MIKVKLEILSWLSETLDIEETCSGFYLELAVKESSTVKDLLQQIATQHPRFKQLVFDTNHRRLDEKVSLFYNNSPLELGKGLETLLHEGDSLVLVPLIQGG
jgi:molybdopterin converting factor small subunit